MHDKIKIILEKDRLKLKINLEINTLTKKFTTNASK